MEFLARNHFELFGLPERFAIDRGALESAYRELLAAVHPDRHVSESAQQKRLAMQAATQANEALRCLRDPLLRAAYLCEIHGASASESGRNTVDPEFLEEQMHWRESLDAARASGDSPALQALKKEVEHSASRSLDQLGRLLDEARNYDQAARCLSRLMFIERVTQQLDDAIDALN